MYGKSDRGKSQKKRQQNEKPVNSIYNAKLQPAGKCLTSIYRTFSPPYPQKNDTHSRIAVFPTFPLFFPPFRAGIGFPCGAID